MNRTINVGMVLFTGSGTLLNEHQCHIELF